MQAQVAPNIDLQPNLPMKMSVLIPTYRRPADLRRCLEAIAEQSRRPDSVIVVCREDDAETHDVVSSIRIGDWIKLVHVKVPGQVAALNAGLKEISGDVVAITDDDAAPWPDWLMRIEQHFMAHPNVGGIGGRDHVRGGRQEIEQTRVGVVQWFGRLIGNHHLGIGAARDVDMLKGANMSFRLAAVGDVRFDERLHGSGAQVHNDIAFSFAIARKGWRLLYDPAVAVDHYPAQRFDEDQRSQKSLLATSHSAYNETLTLLEHLPAVTRPLFLAWALLIGARDLPGIAQGFRLALAGEPVWALLPAVARGRLAALQTSFAGRAMQ
jgi:cellulose synthase/poly-beta-1,6-N-acetylglucosamine synthase-like glycosyltransferase